MPVGDDVRKAVCVWWKLHTLHVSRWARLAVLLKHRGSVAVWVCVTYISDSCWGPSVRVFCLVFSRWSGIWSSANRWFACVRILCTPQTTLLTVCHSWGPCMKKNPYLTVHKFRIRKWVCVLSCCSSCSLNEKEEDDTSVLLCLRLRLSLPVCSGYNAQLSAAQDAYSKQQTARLPPFTGHFHWLRCFFWPIRHICLPNMTIVVQSVLHIVLCREVIFNSTCTRLKIIFDLFAFILVLFGIF